MQTFCKEKQKGRQNGCFHWTWISPSLKSKLLSSIVWIDPNFPIRHNISKLPKFSMYFNFHSRILLADSHSKHILIILVTYLQNFRKLHEFEQDETKHRRTNRLMIKIWNFGRMSILKPQNSIWRAGGITNEITLWNQIKAKNRSNLTPIKPILLRLQTHGKVIKLYSVQKHLSKDCF